jgi:drug/metabolite transporter (DMT)-like permease
MASVWLAIALTLVATIASKLGLVLLKKAIAMRCLSPEPTVGQTDSPAASVPAFLHEPLWHLGMVLTIGGYGIYVLANSFRAAPISLLQPIYASGCLFMAVLAVSFLQERFHAGEWLGLALLLAGLVLLGASIEQEDQQQSAIDAARLLTFLGAGVVLSLALLLLVNRSHASSPEVPFGLLAGVLSGMGYLSTKVVTLAWSDGQWAFVILALTGMGIGMAGSLAVVQWGYFHGRALIVSTINLVTNQLLVVIGGLWCLGEKFPSLPLHFQARLIGLISILAGTFLLARLAATAKNHGH